jgi:hypothetical protein|tara:strand:+ start:87 stop:635 length:549 start_codon:yes stop_codon:yes gene_type:complete
MVNNKTYNNVVNTLLRLGEYHEQISTTSVGDIYDINLEKMQKFPLLHINPVNVSTGDSQLTYNFQIFIMDMVSEKEDWTKNNASANFPKLYKTLSNEQDVFNEVLQICTDFIGMLRHSEQQSLQGTNDINAPIYFTQDQFTIEPFQERFDNLCCGWVFNIGVLVQNDFSTCTIPVTSEGAGY